MVGAARDDEPLRAAQPWVGLPEFVDLPTHSVRRKNMGLSTTCLSNTFAPTDTVPVVLGPAAYVVTPGVVVLFNLVRVLDVIKG